jgi:dTDP-4-dehydrorhamnose reductase
MSAYLFFYYVYRFMHALVLGAGGLLGGNVVTNAAVRGWEVTGTYHTEKPSVRVPLHELDLRDTEGFEAVLDRTEPDAVINCGALTDVDGCEERPEEARSINGQAPGEVARACEVRSIAFAHVSTDYVFDGDAKTPYEESDRTNPIQTYGQSKLAGERAVIGAHGSPLLVRLSFVYGVDRSAEELTGFPAWVRGRLRRGEETSLFTDQWITPSRAGQAAETILALLDDRITGTFHLASRSCVTPYEFGELIEERTNASADLLEEGSQSDVDRPAERPRHTCLDVRRVEEALGREQPTLGEDLDTIAEWL